MIVSQKVMDSLRSIGLNLYERRLWVALLARGTATAGELSEIAKVPRSRTYDVLQSLADKGFVIIQTSKPLKYVAVAPSEALERAKAKLKEELESKIERIETLKQSEIIQELNNLFEKGLQLVSPEEMTGALKGKVSVLQQLESMINSANKRVDIITTPEGLKEIFSNSLDTLKKAKKRGVKIRIAAKIDESCSDVIKAISEVAEVRKLKEELPISGRFYIVDDQQIIFGLTEEVHDTQHIAIWSKSPHAASNVFGPLFNLTWEHSEPIVTEKITSERPKAK
jgi:sugar-specific transcriptional regulator TrmB